jgi:uncharacterized protein (TIGR04255 family)
MSAKKNMRKEYRKPPIAEKVCQFLLTPDTPWDITIPGLIYDKVKEEGFKVREPGVIQQFKFTPSQQATPQMQATQGVRFFTEDKKKFIQVVPLNLAINCLKPCPSWEEFKPMIKDASEILTDTTNVEYFQALRLTYVNRIEIPSSSAKNKLRDYFDFRPFLGQNLPQNPVSFIVGCLLPFHDYRDICKVELQSAMPGRPEQSAFLLRLDYNPAKPGAIPVTDTIKWLEDAHEKIVATFEGCINNRLREIFEEVT